MTSLSYLLPILA